MRIGVMIFPESRWHVAAQQWRTVEELGYDSGWTVDHLWWRSLKDAPWYSTFPFLTCAAMTTERIRLGTLVTSPNFRHPLLVAKDVISLDDVSGGRFTLGVGAGATGAGDTAAINPMLLTSAARADRFREFVELLDRLLCEPVVSHLGRFYTVRDARTLPGCVQRPRVPFAVAAAGRKAQEVAARYGDAWVSCGPLDVARPCGQDEFRSVVREQMKGLDETAERAGRDAAAIDRIVVATDLTGELLRSASAFQSHAEQYAEIGVTELVIQWPRADGVYAGDPTVLERIAADVLPQFRTQTIP